MHGSIGPLIPLVPRAVQDDLGDSLQTLHEEMESMKEKEAGAARTSVESLQARDALATALEELQGTHDAHIDRSDRVLMEHKQRAGLALFSQLGQPCFPLPLLQL